MICFVIIHFLFPCRVDGITHMIRRLRNKERKIIIMITDFTLHHLTYYRHGDFGWDTAHLNSREENEEILELIRKVDIYNNG